MKEKETFTDNTYSLAKSLHHINIAKMYLEDVRQDTSGEVKAVFNQYIIKCDWILQNMRNRVGDENRKVLDMELKDSIILEAINDKLIHLDENQRNVIEELMDRFISGEEVKIFRD
jgi:hypothetical protein